MILNSLVKSSNNVVSIGSNISHFPSYNKIYIKEHKLNKTKISHGSNLITGVTNYFEPIEVMVVVGNYAYFGQNKMVTRLNILTGETAFFTNKSDEKIDALVKMW